MFPTHVYHRAYTATAVSSMTRARRFEFTIAEVSRVRTRSHHLTRLKTIQIAHVVISQQRRSFHRIQTSCFSFHSFLLNFTSSRILRRKKKKRERENSNAKETDLQINIRTRTRNTNAIIALRLRTNNAEMRLRGKRGGGAIIKRTLYLIFSYNFERTCYAT